MTITIPVNPRRKKSVMAYTDAFGNRTRIVVRRPTGCAQWTRSTSSGDSISIRLGRYNWSTLLKHGVASSSVLGIRFLFEVTP